MDDRVSIRATFERFPAAVKGAFLLRGGDGLPHQVRLEAVRADELGGGAPHPVAADTVVLEVSPTQETFVPFEISTMDMPAGWYRLACDVVVDGVASSVFPGERFVMPWPRAAVRRGSVPVGTKIAAISLETVECLGDQMRLAFAADAPPALTLTVDGRPHPVLDVAFDDQAGRGRVVAYPVLRADRQLAIAIPGEAPVEVALP